MFSCPYSSQVSYVARTINFNTIQLPSATKSLYYCYYAADVGSFYNSARKRQPAAKFTGKDLELAVTTQRITGVDLYELPLHRSTRHAVQPRVLRSSEPSLRLNCPATASVCRCQRIVRKTNNEVWLLFSGSSGRETAFGFI
jgi:hypothetical protein